MTHMSFIQPTYWIMLITLSHRLPTSPGYVISRMNNENFTALIYSESKLNPGPRMHETQCNLLLHISVLSFETKHT